ncbi:hypothetical protein BAUCODRAFT_363290 [Baudoinia panamericana UAMH 10762]|uniref:THUMP domain-containing protein n=1 Tax=Baudoinia panamericana (strain UAMH 10762) TaxID=717646 RepID=M2NLM2_BAUPA|nr:uncharacterized protein BAUCODRAFT_363290 [Baudoinia panamericana UAMH 10762]EMD00041.1 hypothetical protein BAUCODRAFT_363290 [Baudoinia panamericana UAMH 10762]
MDSLKRRADDDVDGRTEKRVKKQWRVPRKNDRGAVNARAIQPGDSGIWATCNKGREGKCVGELYDLLAEYAELLYADQLAPDANDTVADDDADDGADIESNIRAEVDGIRKPSTIQLFTSVKVDVQCVVFFKTVAPVQPVALVQRICEDAQNQRALKRTRFVKRLSPMTLMGRASAEGLESVAKQVLAPHFHQQPFQSRRFAIRPTLRNHNTLSRDLVIKQVAGLVGPGHIVDLKNYELLIVVELYANICGVSVVNNTFEDLKRFNLAEIFDPTAKEAAEEGKKTLAQSDTDANQGTGTPAVMTTLPQAMEIS